MDKKMFENLFNSDLNSDKLKLVQKVLERANINQDNLRNFGENSDIHEHPIPKSQNHINSINNSSQTQIAIRNILDKLDNK